MALLDIAAHRLVAHRRSLCPPAADFRPGHHPHGVPMLEAAVFGAFAEVQRVATGLIDGTERSLAAIRGAAATSQENEQLRAEVGAAAPAAAGARPAPQPRTLQVLLDLQKATPLATIAARSSPAAPARLPDADHRQGHAARARDRYGCDRPGRRRRPRDHAEPARRQGPAADRPERSRRRRWSSAPARRAWWSGTGDNRLRDGLRAGNGRHPGWGPRRDLRPGRDLP